MADPDAKTETWGQEAADEADATRAPGEHDAVPRPRLKGEPKPGDALDGFRVLHELGRGGMGVVYRVSDPRLGREVALKVLSKQGAEQLDVERFVREGRVTAQLQHPAIVPVYSLGRTERGLHYYTMRLVRGRTLRDVVNAAHAEPTWTRFRLLQVFVTVCRAVGYAHERDVIHRDLKPSNVMVDEHGGIYVLDWGLAKCLGETQPLIREAPLSLDEEQPITEIIAGEAAATGIVGTPAFMAPEQVSRSVGQVGRAADIYGLGGILYTLLTGRDPRRGSAVSVLRRCLAKIPVPAPSSLEPSVPPQLEALCMHALQPEVDDRPAAAEELADGVQAYLEGRAAKPSAGPDAEFLRTYRAADYRRPSVTVDVVVVSEGAVFLSRRPNPPFQGSWALPGSFVRIEESLEDTARRVLRDEVHVDAEPELEQLGTFGGIDRDPRTRVISTVYVARFQERPALQEGGWFPWSLEGDAFTLEGEPELAFDHAQILRAAARG